MPKYVELPDGSLAEFPDAMDEAAIGAILQRQFQPEKVPGTEKTGLPSAGGGPAVPMQNTNWRHGLPNWVRIPMATLQAVGEGALQIPLGAGDALEAATGVEAFGAGSRAWAKYKEDLGGGYQDLNAAPLKSVEGAATLIGNAVGSSAGFMAPGLAIAKTVGTIDKVGKLSAGAKVAAQIGAGIGASSALETIVDAGGAYRQVMDETIAMGGDKDLARAVAWETVKREFPATALTNAAEFALPGVGNRKVGAVLGFLFEGGQEVLQGEAQRAARSQFGLDNGDVNQTRLEEFVGGAAGGALAGALLSGGSRTRQAPEPAAPSEAIASIAAEDDDGDGDNDGDGGAPTYTPEQYQQALDITMKRKRAASRKDIREGLGVDQKTAVAMLDQMTEEGWLAPAKGKGKSNYWKIVKRPEAQPETTENQAGIVSPDTSEVDPLRPNVYVGESQALEFPTPQPKESLPDLVETEDQERGPSLEATVEATPGEAIPSEAQDWAPEQLDRFANPSYPEELKAAAEAEIANISSTPEVYIKPRDKKKEIDAIRQSLESKLDLAAEARSIKGGDPTDRLIESLGASIAKNEKIGDIKKFMARVEKETGLSAARVEIQPKEAYDVLEAAVNKVVAEQGREAMQPGFDFSRGLEGLRGLMELLPTQTSRSETQIKFQQFSTPPTLAYMAARLTGMTNADTVLEPSAGTGGLASWAKAAGANVITNEIDPKRTDLLKRQGYQVTSEDGEQIHNILPDSVKPTVVLMNPPFSAAGKRGTKNSNDVGYRHVDQAFARLEPGGRLVVILGEGATLDAATAQPFWKSMAAKGNIRANVGLDGKEYSKYGTNFGNRIVVIDKTGPTPGANWLKQRAEIVKGDYKSIEDAWNAVSHIAADRSKSNRPAPAAQASEGGRGVPKDPGKPAGVPQPKSAAPTTGSRTDRGGRTGSRPAPDVLPDRSSASSQSAPAKPAAVPARKPLDAKPGGKLPSAADDAVLPARPVEKAEAGTGAKPDSGRIEAVGKQIIEQIHKLEPVQPYLPVTTQRLRRGLSGIDKATFDQAALELWRREIVSLSLHHDPLNQTPAERELLVDGGDGNYYVAIGMRRGGPTPTSVRKQEAALPARKTEPTEAEIDAKHGEMLADAAAAARERLRKKLQGNQLNSGLDPQDLLDLATIAAEKMRQHGIAFKKWSEPFVQEMGEWVREHLQAIRDRAEEVYDELREKALRSLRPQSASGSSQAPPSPYTGKEDSKPQTKAAPLEDSSTQSRESAAHTSSSTETQAAAVESDQPQAKPTAREDDGGNVVYVPSKLPKSWGAQPHPGRIVETQSMAATDEPDIVLKPNIPWKLVETGAITEVQLNAVALAAQSHERLSADGTRQGFFIGDGTGVGKGREIAATILHHWNSGVKRMVWVSYKDDLIEDAKRDLKDLGADIPIISIKKFKKGQAIQPKFQDGIVFVAYTTLAQSSAPAVAQKDGTKAKDSKAADFYRVQQLADWAGEESMIVFDEAHKAKNAVVAEGGGMRKAKASAAGQAVSHIQDQLKRARVLYASATGFTDPTNIGYAKRLGLWGEGTAFPSFNSFNAAISKGGVGAMEMVSRDMKAQGKYVARFLSYAGVEFSETVHVLTEAQQEIFEAAGSAWRSVFKDINAAMGVTQATSSFAERNAESQFWSANQRFYRAVLTAMKVPTLFREMDEALAADRSVIISVLGTGAAATERALSGMLNEEEGSLDDLDVSPADILKQFVEKSFPIYQFEGVVDDNGQKSQQLVRDSEGNPVINKEAQAMRDALLKDLDGLRMPEAALDQIINRYRTANVAELTGRTQRIIEGEDGKKVLEKRKGESGNSINVEEARLFQEGKKRIAIISNAASTGISLHADRRAKNQQRRVHIILELKWSADDQMQDFGRSHRTNESSQPVYKLLSVNVGADKRFSSSIARRLEQLGALSRGDRASSGAGDIAKYNFETVYGKAAVKAVVERMNRHDSETLQMMGLATEKADAKADQIPVTQFLNRLMSLPLERQNRTFDNFMEAFAEAIETAKRNGLFDAGAEKIQADKLEMVGEPTVIRTDENTGARTMHYEINALQKRDRYTWEEAKEAVRKDHRLMKQKTSGRLVAVAREAYNSKTAVDGSVVGVHRFLAASGAGSMEATDFEKYEPVAADQAAQTAWDEQYKAAGPYKTEHVHLIGGSVLPIYDRLGDGGKPLKVEIAAMPDGQRILGVRIPHSRIKQVMRSLGHGASVTPADVLAGVRESEVYGLASGLKLKKLVRAGQDRIEVVIPSQLVQRVWRLIEPLGGFNENIQYSFRYFLPNDERALEGVQALLKEFPVVEDSTGKVTAAESRAEAPSRSFYSLAARPGGVDWLAGDWVYKARPKETPRVPFEKYSVARLLEEESSLLIKAEGDRPAIMVVNWQTAQIFRQAINGPRFIGALIEPMEAYATMNQLADWVLTEDDLTEELAIKAVELRQRIVEAMEQNAGRGLVVIVRDEETYRQESTSFAETLREELTHWEQISLNADVSTHIDTGPLMQHPAWNRISAYLRNHGYGEAPEQILIIEAAAKIASGHRSRMMLSRHQAREWMGLYLRILKETYGPSAANVLRWARREVYVSLHPDQERPIRGARRSASEGRSEAKGSGSGQSGPDGSGLRSRGTGSVPGRVGESLSPGQTLFARAAKGPGQTSLTKALVKRVREKQRRTDTPDAEYRRILREESGQESTKQLTAEQADRVMARLMTATVPIGAMLRSPSRILARSSAGTKIYQSAEDNWFLQERLNERWAKNWEKANQGTTKAERNRIALYRFADQLREMRDEDAAREWLDSIGEDSSIMDDLEGFLTPKEKAVNEKWTKLFFEPSRKIGIEEGLIDGKQRFTNYLSFYHDSALRMNRKKIRDAAADLAREIGVPIHIAEQLLDKANPKKVKFGSFDFTRQEWSIPGLRDADMIAEIYRKGFARKVAVSRFLQEANPLTKRIVDPALRIYARRYIQQYAGKPALNQVMTDAAWKAFVERIPGLRRLNPSAGELAGWLTAIQYNAKIGFNLFTPMLNLTQTVLNTVPYVGARNAASVLPRAAAAVFLPNSLNPFVRDIARLHRGGIFSDDPGQSKFDRPIFHGAAERVQQAASYIFDKAESLNRATAYLAGLELASQEGLAGDAAVKRAREVVRITQFYSGRLDAPLFARTPIGKVLMQFKTFTIKQLEFVGQLNRKQQIEFALWTLALGGPASFGILQAMRTFFPDWEITHLLEEWQERYNLAAMLQADRLSYQLGLFTVPGAEELGSGRYFERLATWAAGPTISSLARTADASARTLKDPAKYDKTVQEAVRGFVPGGVQWLRLQKAQRDAANPEEALQILTGTERR